MDSKNDHAPVYVQAYAVPDAPNVVYATGVSATPSAPSAPSAPQGSAPPTFVRGPSMAVGHDNFVHEADVREFLTHHHWPIGLQDTFVRNLVKVPIRFFICDDSGSMAASDGKRLTQVQPNQYKLIPCSRWAELTGTLHFHAELARAAGAPTEFRLLNGASPIMIGDGTDDDNVRFNTFKAILDHGPNGGTPLCRHIREVTEQIRRIAPGLRAAGQKACIVIATDGESSDGDIAAALRPLKELPAWVVIRLCTDEDRIVNYWNNIDNELELDMDVLDDLCGEAGEVHEKNPWLTYGEPMHKLREFGIPVKEVDLLDETKLTLEQIRLFCAMIFGGTADSFPHPAIDWNGFKLALQAALQRAPQTWCPIKKTMRPWISLSGIQSAKTAQEGGSSCNIA